MWPVLGGMMTGAASLLGGYFSSRTAQENTDAQIAEQQRAQGETEKFNAQQAEIQRGYTTQMSNTAYQRASADMTAAGLNPMMMFGGGSAASTPSSSAASVSTPSVPVSQKQSPMGGLGEAAKSVVGTAVQAETFNRLTQEIANLKSQQLKTEAETITERERPGKVQAETALDVVRNAYITAETPEAKLRGVTAGDILKMDPDMRANLVKAGFVGHKVQDTINPLLNTAKTILQYRKWY